MSFQAVEAVLKHSRAKHSARLVLLALAHHANKDTELAFLSYSTIERLTQIKSRDTISKALKSLEAAGEIVQVGAKQSGTKVWRIALPGSETELGMSSRSSPKVAASGPDFDNPGWIPRGPSPISRPAGSITGTEQEEQEENQSINRKEQAALSSSQSHRAVVQVANNDFDPASLPPHVRARWEKARPAIRHKAGASNASEGVGLAAAPPATGAKYEPAPVSNQGKAASVVEPGPKDHDR